MESLDLNEVSVGGILFAGSLALMGVMFKALQQESPQENPENSCPIENQQNSTDPSEIQVQDPRNFFSQVEVKELVEKSHKLAPKLRKLEQKYNQQSQILYENRTRLILAQGRVQKERELAKEAEHQLELMQTTVVRLLEEHKKEATKRLSLDQQKKKIEQDIKNFVLGADSDISDQLASITALREQINEQRLRVKEENNLLVRERTRAQVQCVSLNHQLASLKRQYASLQQQSHQMVEQDDESDEDPFGSRRYTNYCTLSNSSLLGSLESDNQDDYFGGSSLHYEWGLGHQDDEDERWNI